MSYATKQDMIDRFGETELAQLTDRAAGTTIDDDVLDGALEDADATIDAYVGQRYDLPLASTPRLLTTAACDIARYRLHEDHPPEVARDRYDQAIALLKSIARGEAALDAGGTEPAASPGSATVTSADRVFSRSKLQGF